MKIRERLNQALERRRPLLTHPETTNAWRVLGTQEGEGVTLDRYGEYGVIHVFENEMGASRLLEMADWAMEALELKGVYLKRFISDRSATLAEDGLYQAKPFRGAEAPESFLILENGAQFEIRLYAGFSTGLFLDQRDNRAFLASKSRGKRVLNLFAYTCGFSVQCALAGAETVSVDVSKKYLDWGRRNFAANSLSVPDHRFYVEETRAFLTRAERRGERFDLVILDPPSFGRDKKGKTFSIQRDLKNVVGQAAGLLESGGLLFVSSNYAQWTSRLLEKEARKAIGSGPSTVALPKTTMDFVSEVHCLSNVLFKV